MNPKIYTFDAILQKVPDVDGAYINFPYDVRQQHLTASPTTAASYA